MEEIEPSSDSWNWEWKNSIQVRGLEPGSNTSISGIGNGGVRAQFRRWETGMEEFEESSRLGIGNERVRVKFQFLESGMEVRGLESGM